MRTMDDGTNVSRCSGGRGRGEADAGDGGMAEGASPAKGG
ncbi:unnamed protein product [Ectocarpus sp. CCAP 1310/34]|nr:unnamed protein product [Ectocarpus sp. CCAP 1310/34]